MNRVKNLLLIVAVVLLSGCAGTLNQHNAEKYGEAAFAALEKGDWKTARMYYSRAWGNAKKGGAPIRNISVLRYEYGRASGVMCDWAEAEQALNEAYALDMKSGGPFWMPLVELERMSIAKKDYAQALKYFEILMPVLKKMRAETKDPLGYADILDEYVLALENNGRALESEKWKARSLQIRTTFPDAEPHTDITPYGMYCSDEINVNP